ncbi:MAG: PKD domain-containing protein [Thermoleophilia bacterium]
MTRPLRALLLTVAGTLAAAVPAGAAVSTGPDIALPTYTQGKPLPNGSMQVKILWQPAEFSTVSAQNHEDVRVQHGDAAPVNFGPLTTESFVTDTFQNGDAYSVSVAACTAPSSCFSQAPGAASIVAGSSRIDDTRPTGTMVINGGAPYTNSRNVTLDMTATDPLIGGVPGSAAGVDEYAVDIDGNGSFVCTSDIMGGIVDNSGCGRPFTTSGTAVLPAGDGAKTLGVEFGDAARTVGLPCATIPCQSLDLSIRGNQSLPVTDSIVLDTTRPVAQATPGTITVPQGGTATLNSSASTDPGALPSGVEAAGTTWDFKDGTPVETGGQVTHTFAKAGTFTGQMVVKDRAGNASDASEFTVVVTPAPAGGGGGQTIDGTGQGGGGQTAGDTTRRTPRGLTLTLTAVGTTVRAGGTLKLPSGALCAGVVRLTVRRGHTTRVIGARLALRKGQCVYSVRLRGVTGARVSARFAGTRALTPLGGPTRRV